MAEENKIEELEIPENDGHDLSNGNGGELNASPGNGGSDIVGADGGADASDGRESGGSGGDGGDLGGPSVNSGGGGGGDSVSDAGGSGNIPDGSEGGIIGDPVIDPESGSGRRRGRKPRSDRPASSSGGGPSAGNGSQVDVAGSDNLKKERKPKDVSESLFDDTDFSKLTKSGEIKILAQVLRGLFFIPQNILQQEHWGLTPEEAVELGKAVQGFIETLPKKQKKAWDEIMKKHAPLINLTFVFGAIMWGRVDCSIQLAKINKLEKENARLKNTNAGFSSTAGSDTGSFGGGINGGSPEGFIVSSPGH